MRDFGAILTGVAHTEKADAMHKVVRMNSRAMPVHDGELEILRSAGADVAMIEGATEDEVVEAASDCEALMVCGGYVRRPVVDALDRCRIISRMGIGTDKIDVERATARGIVVTNVPDFCTNEVADHTMALLLAAARQLPLWERRMREGPGPGPVFLDSMQRLGTQTLGLIGLGRIGSAVASRARAFGLTVIAFDPNLSAEDAEQVGVEAVDFETVLARSDFLALMCPLTGSTRGMLGAAEFKKMKRSAVLVNTSRGELVDEDALAAALRDGVIRWAAIDVYGCVNVLDPDGFATDHPLFSLENVIRTPHVAAVSVQALAEARIRAAEAVADVLGGRWPKHPVNPEVRALFERRTSARR